MKNKYSEDFGEALKEIANDPDADPEDLLYFLIGLESIGILIKEGKYDENIVNLVFEKTGITNEILMKIVDKFLLHVENNMKK